MIKKTVCFSHPAYLSLRNGQMIVKLDPHDDLTEQQASLPIEDIGLVVLDHRQITITSGVMEALLENNAAVVTCDDSHIPRGLLLPLEGHTVQQERFEAQTEASTVLKKQLWQQTVVQKIRNQAAVLQQTAGKSQGNMLQWARDVRSGDSTNLEGRAAAYYWSQLFKPDIEHFVRDRSGEWPNAMLNYGYAILRAMVARGLVGSGLLPTMGIHHHNRYNAYCLADDVMEPYRPYVDRLVVNLMIKYRNVEEINKDLKRELLGIPTIEVTIGGQRSPLMVAVSTTTASLAKCYTGELRKIAYPQIDG
ncbi:MAG: type II CRISPR-associated endonuclease Cas1 [Bacteroidales bacterium]|nr:type II CRISPR-associated endonuclease Cas1 [Bacteroidales bacterium]MBQ6742584.1 type II CRISPR-associated endonuclease Cas1 [Bacteroidales bacterium]MBQ6742589.1 type II CRISPR-associated endonuclease Cas1 [Bacteroidales bacterium]